MQASIIPLNLPFFNFVLFIIHFSEMLLHWKLLSRASVCILLVIDRRINREPPGRDWNNECVTTCKNIERNIHITILLSQCALHFPTSVAPPTFISLTGPHHHHHRCNDLIIRHLKRIPYWQTVLLNKRKHASWIHIWAWKQCGALSFCPVSLPLLCLARSQNPPPSWFTSLPCNNGQ